MQSTKKAVFKREDGQTSVPDEPASVAPAAISITAQQQTEGEEDPQTKEGNKENKPKGGGRRRGGQRHKGKSQASSTATPAGAVGGC